LSAAKTRGRGQRGIYFSIPFADYATARPSSPSRPAECALRSDEDFGRAGIQVGIGIAPTIPGLSTDIPGLLQRAKDCGATSIHQYAAFARQRRSLLRTTTA